MVSSSSSSSSAVAAWGSRVHRPRTHHLRRPASGELDIWFSFELDLDPPEKLVEALRAIAYQILALLNLRLEDFLRPTMPFQIREMLPNGQAGLMFGVQIAVKSRLMLSDEQLCGSQLGVAHFLTDANYGEKYRIALELYRGAKP